MTGPPPGAKKAAKRRLEELPVQHVDIDESVAERPVFSPAVFGIIGGALVVGLAFGFMMSTSSNARSLYDNQTEGARMVRDKLKPAVAEAEKGAKAVTALNPNTPEFDKVSALAKIKIAPDPGLLAAGSQWIGGGNVYNITSFASKAAMLQEMIKRHDYLTNQVDKEELEKLVEGNELLKGDKNFAVIYNHKQLLDHLKNKRDDKAFKPANGSLVLIDKFEVDDEGNVPYARINSKNEGAWPVRGVIPLKIDDILKTGGETALTRYKRRVGVLQFYAKDLLKSSGGIVDELDKLADRGGAPFLQLSNPEPPPAEAAAPAE